MTEPAFREIQLTKKQLVFLFMASVVLAAVVFLLGVSLGRRLPTSEQAVGPIAAATDDIAANTTLPATTLGPEDTAYAAGLQRAGVVPPATDVPRPATTSTPPAVEAPAAPAPTTAAPAPKPAAEPTPPARGASTPAAAPATTKPEPPAPGASAGSWFVQVNAFRSRENADLEVKKLKSQGHSAFVAPGGSLFRVRVGPFSDRANADAAATKLRQGGFKPSVTR